MSEEIELPSQKELAKLSKASMVVYALRCALRVQPLLVLWKKPTAEYKEAVVKLNTAYKILVYAANNDAAKAAAEAATKAATKAAFDAATADAFAYADVAAYAARAARAASAAADAATVNATAGAAYNAATAADAANAAAAMANAAAEAADAAARADYARLQLPIEPNITDASETGPLGDLWHGSPPQWYLKAKVKFDKTTAEWERDVESPEERAKRYEDSDPEPLISVYFDDNGFTKEEMAAFLEYVTESYRSLGGEGLKVVDGKTLLPENAKVVL